MSEMVTFAEVENRILTIHGQQVLLDRDVAELYGVETMRVNEAVKNNPAKFPDGYIIPLSIEAWRILKSKISISRSSWGGKNTPPKAFTEKGLYMLATILKSSRATQTTLAIVEVFAKLREFSGVINQLPNVQGEEQKKLMQRSGKLFADIFDSNAMELVGDETTIELNLAMMKLKHTAKREKKAATSESEEWHSIVADKDSEIAQLREQLVKLEAATQL